MEFCDHAEDEGVATLRLPTARSLTSVDRHAIARALARGLAEMSKLTWPIAGRFVPETGTVEPFSLEQEIKFPLHAPKRPLAGTPSPTDPDRVVPVIRALVERTRKYNDHATAEDELWTNGIITNAYEAMKVPFESSIVMQDYHEDNVVVERHSR